MDDDRTTQDEEESRFRIYCEVRDVGADDMGR